MSQWTLPTKARPQSEFRLNIVIYEIFIYNISYSLKCYYVKQEECEFTRSVFPFKVLVGLLFESSTLTSQILLAVGFQSASGKYDEGHIPRFCNPSLIRH